MHGAFLWMVLWSGSRPSLAEKNVPEKNRPPPIPPRPQGYSKGTATNLPEKEISAFLSVLLNEALTLLWFHRTVQRWRRGWGHSLARVMQGWLHSGYTPVPPWGSTPWPSTLVERIKEFILWCLKYSTKKRKMQFLTILPELLFEGGKLSCQQKFNLMLCVVFKEVL